MRRIISCQFNIDTACVDVEYEDGFVLSIYTPAVEDAVAHTMQQRSELDWLIYNDPLAYVGLVMSGKSEEYLKAVTRYLNGRKSVPIGWSIGTDFLFASCVIYTLKNLERSRHSW